MDKPAAGGLKVELALNRYRKWFYVPDTAFYCRYHGSNSKKGATFTTSMGYARGAATYTVAADRSLRTHRT